MKVSGFLFISCCILFFISNANGQTGWKWGRRSINGIPGLLDGYQSFCVVGDKKGNTYLSGRNNYDDSMSFGPITVYNPLHNIQLIIARLDSGGNFTWVNGSQNSDVFVLSTATDSVGNLYVLGVYDSSSFTFASSTLYGGFAFLMKVSPTGSVIWARNIPVSSWGTLTVGKTGYLYVAGSFGTTISIDTVNLVDTNYNYDVYILKFDSLGNAIKGIFYGGDCDAYADRLAVDDDGQLYVYGQYIQAIYYPSGFIVFGGDTLRTSYHSTLGQHGNYLAKLDAELNPVWAEKLNSHFTVNAIRCDLHNHIYATGFTDTTLVLKTDTLLYAGGGDIFLAKYDSSGNYVWAKSYGGIDYESGCSIALDDCEHFWISGQLGQGINIPYSVAFGSHVLTAITGTTYPIFMAEFDTAGSYINGVTVASNGSSYNGIVLDEYGNFYIGGDYGYATMVFGPDTLSWSLPTTEYLLAAKYKYDTNYCIPFVPLPNYIPSAKVGNISIYPNPANQECYIHFSGVIDKNSTITIFEVSGKPILTHSFTSETLRLSLKDVPSGIYVCQIRTGYSLVTEKFIVDP